jgi:ABC-2 type transport system permease protein
MIFANELLKTYSRWRSYIAFIALGVIVPLVLAGLKLQGEALVGSVTAGLARDFLLVGNLLNGYFVTVFLMNALWIHIPFLLTLVAGDQLAGEAASGTFRLLLTRPASRSRILAAKYGVTLLYTTSVVAFFVLLSLALGILLFGTGVLLHAGRVLTVLPAADAPGRIVLATALAIWGMWTVASLAFFFSSLVDNALGPILGTMAVLIVCYVVSGIPLDLFQSIRPMLFTTYLSLWQRAMEQPLPWREVAEGVLVLGGYSVGFYLSTWYIFSRKDILS